MVEYGFDVGWLRLVAVDFARWVPTDVLDAAVGLCCYYYYYYYLADQ